MIPSKFIEMYAGHKIGDGKGLHVLLTKYAELMSNLVKFRSDVMTNGGATMSISIVDVPKYGYMVSLPDRERVFSGEISDDDVRSFVTDRIDDLSDFENFLGGWIDKGKVYLDVSVHVEDRDQALMMGKLFKQKAIYDIAAGESIYL
jgi:hypothetical protein